MKKLVSYTFNLFILIFIGILNVKATSFGDIKNTSAKSFTFPINGASGSTLDYSDYSGDIKCSADGLSSKNVIEKESITVNCTVEKDEYKIIKLNIINSSGKKTESVEWEINSSNKITTTTKTTTASTTVVKSNNANLKSISIKDTNNNELQFSPTFKSDTYRYSLSVSGTVEKIVITPTLEDSKATFTLSSNASKELTAGETTDITITVIPESGQPNKIYTISVKREALSTDATLKSIKIKELSNFKFNKSKDSYNITIGKDIDELTITAEANDKDAKVNIENNENIKDETVIRITVEAPDGTKKLYKLNVSKKDNVKTTTKNTTAASKKVEKSPLIILILSMIAFSLIGGIIYIIKEK